MDCRKGVPRVTLVGASHVGNDMLEDRGGKVVAFLLGFIHYAGIVVVDLTAKRTMNLCGV